MQNDKNTNICIIFQGSFFYSFIRSSSKLMNRLISCSKPFQALNMKKNTSNYAFELGRSFGENKLPQYIVEEVQKIKSADLIIFQVGE